MKTLAFTPLLFLAFSNLQAIGQVLTQRCATAYYDSVRKATDPGYRRSRERFEKLIQEATLSQRSQRRTGTEEDILIEIPVVVHVIHNNRNGTIGGRNNSNIADEQIYSQIEVLNKDFRRLNEDADRTPAEFKDIVADLRIEFRLAQTNPDGQPTNGITRHYSSTTSFLPEDMKELATIVSWPTNRYLNIWVVKEITDEFIGYTQFPDATYPVDLPGIPDKNGYGSQTDGILIEHIYFGRVGTVRTPYNQGRTMTHEVGHWLGLLHIWGDTDCGNDYIDDTPTAFDSNLNGSTSCTAVYSSCNGQQTRNMIENYMDYSPDACMNLFTKHQSERIRRVLELSPRRKELLEHIGAQQPLPQPELLTISKVYNNPYCHTEAKPFQMQVLFKGRQTLVIDVFDSKGNRVISQTYFQTRSDVITLDLGFLASGIYVAQVNVAGQAKTQKIAVLP